MKVTITRENFQRGLSAVAATIPTRTTLPVLSNILVETLEDGLAEMRFIQDFHQNGRGWTDIGYHYCVDDAGRIYEGVPRDFRGTHVGGANTGNIGISMFGNFEIAEEYPTTDSMQSLVAMWAWLALRSSGPRASSSSLPTGCR